MSNDFYLIDFTGYSMAPALRPGDRLLVRRVSPNRILLGDILLRRHEDRQIVAHRLVQRLSPIRGITKGDALGRPDALPILLTGPTERVEAILREGRLIFLSSALGRWRNRWHAVISRSGISSMAFKRRIKRAFVGCGPSGGGAVKPALAKFLNGAGKEALNGFERSALMHSMLQEGVAGIVYTKRDQRQREAAGARQMRRSYQAAVAANLACIGFLEQLEVLLTRERIPVMTLKGASLLDRCYSKVGMRPMEDLDLMVRPAHRDRFAQILVGAGFTQNRWRTDRFQKPYLTIDLHVHPLHTERIHNRNHLLPGGIEPLWQRSAPWRIGFNWIRRPADGDNVLLLCLHVLKHYYARLIWLEDLRRLLQERDRAFWISLMQRADSLGCAKPLAYCLYLLDTLYPNFTGPGSDSRGLQPFLSNFEKGLLLLTISDRPLPLAAPVLEMLALGESRHRWLLAFETLFPKRAIRQAEFGLVRPLQRLLFVPRRLVRTLKLLQENLFTIFRILARALS